MTRTNKLLATFLLITCLISCNKKNQYSVNLISPSSSTSGTFSKFLAKYATTEYKIPIDPDSLISVYDNLFKSVYGGVLIDGTLTIEHDYIKFSPAIGSSLLFDKIKEIQIPTTDIVDVKSESYLVITKKVVITTINGDFEITPRIKSTLKVWKNEYYETDICNDIKKVMQK